MDFSAMSDEDLMAALEASGVGTGAPATSAPAADFSSMSDADLMAALASTGQKAPSTGTDMAKSFGAGVVRGAAEAAMSPVTLPGMLRQGVDYVYDRAEDGVRGAFGMEPVPEAVRARQQEMAAGPLTRALEAGTSAVRRWMDERLYAPQTGAGRYAGAVGEFLPGAAAPGGIVRKAAQVVVPAVLSETAGHAAEGTAWEAPARIGGALLGSVTAGAGAGVGTAGKIIQRGAKGIDEATINADWSAAASLMRDAEAAGVRLTPAEALNQVSNGRYSGLAATQMQVENAPGAAGAVMGDFMSRRPEQVQTAGRAAIDDLAPREMDPNAAGRAVQGAAQGVIDDTRGAINRDTRPLYDAARQDRIAADDWQGLAADPAFAFSLKRLREDPVVGPGYADLPDDSVAVVDAVTKDMFARQKAAGSVVNPGFDPERAALFGAGADGARSAASRSSAPYAQALGEQAARRQAELEPLEAGMMGRLAGTSDIGAQRGAMFPRNPEAGIADEIGTAVRQIAKRNPKAAQALVRQHAESVFAEATRDLQNGPNQFGGAKFAVILRGNGEAGASLEAAVRSLPKGATRWAGFERFLDVLEATGQRLPVGSRTAFNQQAAEAMKSGGIVGETASLAAGAGVRLPGRIRQAYEQWTQGKNTQQLAVLLTDPEALSKFERLLKLSPKAVQARNLTYRLFDIAEARGGTLNKTRAAIAAGAAQSNREKEQ